MKSVFDDTEKRQPLDLISRAATILRLMRPESGHADWGISELSERSGLSVATVHRILEALQKQRLVDKDPATRRYRLGLGLLELGLAMAHSLEIRAIAHPIMGDLARSTMEAVYLTLRDEMEGVSVERVDSPHAVRLVQPIGVRLPLHQGASRKAMLAHLPPADLERYFAAHPTVQGLAPQLQQIRRQGYAMSVNEVSAWASSVAAPIFDFRGDVIAGLAVSGPRERFATEVLPRAIEAVQLAAADISRRLGHGAGPSRLRPAKG